MQATKCAYKNCPNFKISSLPDLKHPCAYCTLTFYCSITCRILDWETGHKRTCINAPAQTGPDLSFEPKPVCTDPLSIISGNSSKSMQDYEVININNRSAPDLLGKGSFGQVKLVRDKSDPTKLFALKILKKKQLQISASMDFLKREIRIQGKLNHPHIIMLYHAFEDRDNVYLVLEYAENGNLFCHLRSKKKLSEREAFVYFFQTCLGIDYLHKKGIIHRDLKPENLLLDKRGNIKLCDFGYSAEDFGQRNTFCGTVDYMAPEVVLKKNHDTKVDIWSLGVLLFELLQGYPPFQGFTSEEKFKSIVSNQIKFEEISDNARDLISRLLRSEPKLRPEFSEIFEHPWLKKYEAEFNMNMRDYIYMKDDEEIPSPIRKDKSPKKAQKMQESVKENIQDSSTQKKRNGSQVLETESSRSPNRKGEDRDKSQERKSRLVNKIKSEASEGNREGDLSPFSKAKIDLVDLDNDEEIRVKDTFGMQDLIEVQKFRAANNIDNFHSPKFKEYNKTDKEKLNRSISPLNAKENSYSPVNEPKLKDKSTSPRKKPQMSSLSLPGTEDKGKMKEKGEKTGAQNDVKETKPMFIVNKQRILQDLFENENTGQEKSPSKRKIKSLAKSMEFNEAERAAKDKFKQVRAQGKRSGAASNREYQNNKKGLLDNLKNKIVSLYNLQGEESGVAEVQIVMNYNKEKEKQETKSARQYITSKEGESKESSERMDLNKKEMKKMDSKGQNVPKRRVSKYESPVRKQEKVRFLTEIAEDIDLEEQGRVSRVSYKNVRFIQPAKEPAPSQFSFFSKIPFFCGCVNRNDSRPSSGNKFKH